MPTCDMQAQVRAALARADAGSRELEAIHAERVKLGHAIESTEQHLTNERSLFSQLRTDVGQALRHAFCLGQRAVGGGVDGTVDGDRGRGRGEGEGGSEDSPRGEDSRELAATTRTLDELLAMGRWRAETALKALRPVREAAAAVAAAARRTASMLVPEPGEVPDWLIDGSWSAPPLIPQPGGKLTAAGAGVGAAVGGGGGVGKREGVIVGAAATKTNIHGGGAGGVGGGIGCGIEGNSKVPGSGGGIWPVKPPQLSSTLGIGRVETHNIPPVPPPVLPATA